MSLRQIQELLESTGLPTAYRAWPENDAPPLPFICYLVSRNNNFAADGTVYMPVQHIQIELYTKQKEPETEDKVEKALSSVFWSKTETYISTEQVYEILYEIEV